MNRRRLGILALIVVALALVSMGAWQWWTQIPDNSGSSVKIDQLDPDHDAEPVNESRLRQDVPTLARALDEMIHEDAKRASYPNNETTRGWLEYLNEEIQGSGEGPFEYRDRTFSVFIVES